MTTFVISVNGKRKCQAGVGTDGVLTASLAWVGEKQRKPEYFFHLGGIGGRKDEFVRWRAPRIKTGDTITIEVVESKKLRCSHFTTQNEHAKKKTHCSRKSKHKEIIKAL